MKLRIIKIFSLLFMFGWTSCSKPTQIIKKNDLENLNLKGSIKTLRKVSYEANTSLTTGKMIKGEKKSKFSKPEVEVLYSFNLDGNISEVKSFNSSGILLNKLTNIYDNGNLIKSVFIVLVTDKQIQKKATSIEMLNNGSWEEIYEYDNDGLMISTERKLFNEKYKKGFRLFKSDYFVYDSNRNLIKSGAENRGRKYKYDRYGNQVEAISYDEDQIHWKGVSKFENGNLIEAKFYWYDEYDDLGNKINWDASKYTLDISTYSYDKHDNKISENFDTFDYNYDTSNNWISVISYFNKKPTFIIEREIVYYD